MGFEFADNTVVFVVNGKEYTCTKGDVKTAEALRQAQAEVRKLDEATLEQDPHAEKSVSDALRGLICAVLNASEQEIYGDRPQNLLEDIQLLAYIGKELNERGGDSINDILAELGTQLPAGE